MNKYTERFKEYLIKEAFSTCPHDGRNALWDEGIDKILERGMSQLGPQDILDYLDKLFDEQDSELNSWSF